jgi:hypothetical protein
MEVTRVISERNSEITAEITRELLTPVGGNSRVIGPEPGGEQAAPLSLFDLLQPEDEPEPPRIAADPRPDLAKDSADWLRLIRLAFQRDGTDPAGVFDALFGIRCCGARLERASGKWRIKPPPDQLSPGEWEELRTSWLVPHQKAIAELLAALGPA